MKVTIVRQDVPETRLHVAFNKQMQSASGAGRQAAFVLPGGPGIDHRAYRGYACLENSVDVIFHDPRGCGASDPADYRDCNMSNYIDDIESLRQHFNLGKIVVIGKSYGSMCALGYALRYPDSVAKLVLAAGAPSYRFLDTAKKNLKRLGSADQIEICQKLWAGGFSSRDELLRFFELTHSLYSVKSRHAQRAAHFQDKLQQFSYQVLNEGFRQEFWHFDYEHELHHVLCPTLILAGREDWINDVSHAEFMAGRIPHSQLRIFEQAGHALESDAADEYFLAIREFIAD